MASPPSPPRNLDPTVSRAGPHLPGPNVTRIVDDLTLGGYVVKEKEGRRNRYQIQVGAPLHEALGWQQKNGTC
jgi:hypothetical protein